MRQETAEAYVRAKLTAQGLDIIQLSDNRYALKKIGARAKCGSLVIPDLTDIPEEVAVSILDAEVLDSIDAAIKDPAFKAR
jgi:hypothetical protein